MSKGEVSLWIWIVGGLIIGASVIIFATTMATGFFKSYQENTMRERFLNLANRAESICSGGEGNLDYFEFPLSEVVRTVYPAKNRFERPPDKVSELISDKEQGTGTFICISFFEKQEPSCKEVSCPVVMDYIGTPSLKEDLFSLLAKIRGEYPVYTYNLDIEKVEGKVWVTRQTVGPTVALDGLEGVEILGTCEGNPVLVSAADGKVLLFGDATLWVNGNTEFAKLLSDAYAFLGKGRLLVVYEDDYSNPAAAPKIKTTLESLTSDPFIKHTGDISVMSQDFVNYDQLWIVRPGWCSAGFRMGDSGAGCGETIPWSKSETDAISSFVSGGGHVFIITDYQGSGTGETRVDHMPTGTANDMLQSMDMPFVIGDGYVCRKSSLDIKDREAFPSPARMDIKYASLWQKVQ